MSDKEEDKALEQALAQMLRPVKGIPFPVIIKSLSGQEVIPMNKESASDLYADQRSDGRLAHGVVSAPACAGPDLSFGSGQSVLQS